MVTEPQRRAVPRERQRAPRTAHQRERPVVGFASGSCATFALSSVDRLLRGDPVEETPDLGFNGTQTFADFVNQNASRHQGRSPGRQRTTPSPAVRGAPFRGGSVFNNSSMECAGHHRPRRAVPRVAQHMQRLPRARDEHRLPDGHPRVSPGPKAQLSPFLTGTTVFDQFSGQVRTLNDLARRRRN